MHPAGFLRKRDQLVTEDTPTQHTTNTRNEHPCPQWDLNSWSQESSSFRPMPWTTQPLGWVFH